MSDALRKELVGTGVKVTNILPGVCNTPMFVRYIQLFFSLPNLMKS